MTQRVSEDEVAVRVNLPRSSHTLLRQMVEVLGAAKGGKRVATQGEVMSLALTALQQQWSAFGVGGLAELARVVAARRDGRRERPAELAYR